MGNDIKHFTDFLVSLGAEKIEHSGEHFLAHLIAVCRDLRRWGCEEPVCLAGLFHSIYGTEKFQSFSLSLERREELRDLIGERAERLSYFNSAMDRPSFDGLVAGDGPGPMGDRFTGATVDLTPLDFTDLCRVQVCDWLEQVPRTKEWDYRRQAYRQMAQRLGAIAQTEYDRVFGLETADASGA